MDQIRARIVTESLKPASPAQKTGSYIQLQSIELKVKMALHSYRYIQIAENANHAYPEPTSCTE